MRSSSSVGAPPSAETSGTRSHGPALHGVAAGSLGLGTLAGVFLIICVALAFLPGQSTVPPIDRDEPRYTQATKQMLETGDFVAIRFQDAPRHKKPIGIHWLQAGAATLSGRGAEAPLWVYRLPSLAGAIGALLLSVWAARAFLPLPLALTAGALFGATIILGVEARLAKTDAALLATILAMQGALARLWLAERRPLAMAIVFWVALALGILIKGPIAPMVAGLTVLTLLIIDRRALLAKLRILIGLPILAAICLPWYVAIYFATDGAFFVAALGTDFFGKAATGQEGHGAPPLTHIAFFFAVAWPLAPFVLASVWHGVRQRSDAVLFAFAWAVPAWIVFELTPTKLPHYTLPLLPALAIAAVATLAPYRAPRILRILAAILIAAPPIAVLAASPFLMSALGSLSAQSAALLEDVPVVSFAAVLAIAAAAGIYAAWQVIRGTRLLDQKVIAPALAAAIIAQAGVWGIGLPALQPVWISTRLVEAAHTLAPCEAPRLVSVGGFNEPSMIFLSGTDTALATAEQAASIAAQECAVVAARAHAVEEVEEAARDASVALRRAGVVEGFNISKGDPITLTLFVAGEEAQR
ncbi:MAG: glycosyltransferase family 39 protein [Pseudomonadota bacterium]